jgi:Na(+)/H(+) antiporter nhaA
VPVFAFFSAGVAMGGFDGLKRALTDSVSLGIMFALVFGKTIGITGTTWLVTRFRHANLDPDVQWIDVIGLAVTGGIGFTVSLLVAELSFTGGSPHGEDAKIAILFGSVTAAILGALILSRRNKHYRLLAEKESVDADMDGIPDVFQQRKSQS